MLLFLSIAQSLIILKLSYDFYFSDSVKLVEDKNLDNQVQYLSDSVKLGGKNGYDIDFQSNSHLSPTMGDNRATSIDIRPSTWGRSEIRLIPNGDEDFARGELTILNNDITNSGGNNQYFAIYGAKGNPNYQMWPNVGDYFVLRSSASGNKKIAPIVFDSLDGWGNIVFYKGMAYFQGAVGIGHPPVKGVKLSINGTIQLRSFDVSDLPSPSTVGLVSLLKNSNGVLSLVFSDGSSWLSLSGDKIPNKP